MKNKQVIAGQVYEIGNYSGNTEKYLICVFDKSNTGCGYCCAVDLKSGGALRNAVSYEVADMSLVFGDNWQNYRLVEDGVDGILNQSFIDGQDSMNNVFTAN